MTGKKLPMDLLTTYKKDYVQMFVRRSPLHQDEKENSDLLSGPYTEYILPAYKWDEQPGPNAKYEHPDDFFKRMWDSKEIMPTYTGESKECYCVKMLNKRPELDPPDKNIVAQHYKNKNKTVYQMEICNPDDKYVLLKKTHRKVSEPLPSNWEIPLTTQRCSYRPLEISKKHMDISPSKSFKPVGTMTVNEKIREIMKTKTGESEYEGVIGDLGGMIIREQMHGEIKRREIANEFEIMRQQHKLI